MKLFKNLALICFYIHLFYCGRMVVESSTQYGENGGVKIFASIAGHTITPDSKIYQNEPFELNIRVITSEISEHVVDRLQVHLDGGWARNITVDPGKSWFSVRASFSSTGTHYVSVAAIEHQAVIVRTILRLRVFSARPRFLILAKPIESSPDLPSITPVGPNTDMSNSKSQSAFALPTSSVVDMEARVVDRFQELHSDDLTLWMTKRGITPYVSTTCSVKQCPIILQSTNFNSDVDAGANNTYSTTHSSRVYLHPCDSKQCWTFRVNTGSSPSIVTIHINTPYVTYGLVSDMEENTPQVLFVSSIGLPLGGKPSTQAPRWTNTKPIVRKQICFDNFYAMLYPETQTILFTADNFLNTVDFKITDSQVVWKDTGQSVCSPPSSRVDCTSLVIEDIGVSMNHIILITNTMVLALTPSRSSEGAITLLTQLAAPVPSFDGAYQLGTGQDCMGISHGFMSAQGPLGHTLQLLSSVSRDTTHSFLVSVWGMEQLPVEVAAGDVGQPLLPTLLETLLQCSLNQGPLLDPPSFVFDLAKGQWLGLVPCKEESYVALYNAEQQDWVFGFAFPRGEKVMKLVYHQSGLGVFAFGEHLWFSQDSDSRFVRRLNLSHGDHVVSVSSSAVGPEYVVHTAKGEVYVGILDNQAIERVITSVQGDRHFVFASFDWMGQLNILSSDSNSQEIHVALVPVDSLLHGIQESISPPHSSLVPSALGGDVVFQKFCLAETCDTLTSNVGRNGVTLLLRTPSALAVTASIRSHFEGQSMEGSYSTFSATVQPNAAIPQCSAGTAHQCAVNDMDLVIVESSRPDSAFWLQVVLPPNAAQAGWTANNRGMGVLIALGSILPGRHVHTDLAAAAVLHVENATHALAMPVLFPDSPSQHDRQWPQHVPSSPARVPSAQWALVDLREAPQDEWHVSRVTMQDSVLCISEPRLWTGFQTGIDLRRVIIALDRWTTIAEVLNHTCVAVGGVFWVNATASARPEGAWELHNATIVLRRISDLDHEWALALAKSPVRSAPPPAALPAATLALAPCPYQHFIVGDQRREPTLNQLDKHSSLEVLAVSELAEATCAGCQHHSPGVYTRNIRPGLIRVLTVHQTRLADWVLGYSRLQQPGGRDLASPQSRSLMDRAKSSKRSVEAAVATLEGSDLPAEMSFMLAPPLTALTCPLGERGAIYRASFGCPKKRLWLDPASYDLVADEPSWFSLPTNYRPPSHRGEAIPLSQAVYNADPSQPLHHGELAESRELARFKQCAGLASRAACNCTAVQRESALIANSDCIQRARDVSYRNVLVPKVLVLSEEVLDPRFPSVQQEVVTSPLRLRELNGRFDYCSNATWFDLSQCGEQDRVENLMFHPSEKEGIVFVGSGLYHFEVTPVESISYCDLRTEFIVYVTQSPLTRGTEALSVSLAGIVIAFLLLGMYWYASRKDTMF